MIDNIEQIKSLLVFDTADDFYHLQIIKRKKEHADLGSNSYIVKTYYIRSLEYLNLKYEEIKMLCDHHNARACINLNRRSFEKIAFHTLKKITDQLLNKDFKSVRKAYESCCGTYANEPHKKWILDFDTKDESIVGDLLKVLDMLRPEGDKFITRLYTKNGYHIITSPFDIEAFRTFSFECDIHKDNPTILYIP